MVDRRPLVLDAGVQKELPIGDVLTADIKIDVFTPTFSFATAGDLSVSYSSQQGQYAKLGKFVYFWIRIVFTPTYTTSSGNAQILGLPYISDNVITSRWFTAHTPSNITWPSTNTQMYCTLTSNSTGLTIASTKSASTGATWTTAQFPTATAREIRTNGAYITT